MGLSVTNPGLMALIVDYGRNGHQHIGVSVGGPMDEHAYLWANRLLGNNYGDPQIEITFGMFECRLEAATSIAVTGADLGTRINGRPVRNWRAHAVKAGDVISCANPVSGLRAYLAVKGGFRVDRILGSSTTVVRDRLGGLAGDGTKLKQGDRIPFEPSTDQLLMSVPAQFIPDYERMLELGVILGYQERHFPADEIARFFATEYQVTQEIDRMGYRLAGDPIACDLDGILSEGISYGAVQIPRDGQPIILLRDRQTIGGYPKIGCICSLDAARLSQRKPGDQVKFRQVALTDAVRKKKVFDRFFGIQPR
ncbi:MAG: biotin-dependent carboxyltransferase [Gammaproteobacteria bacterium]|nr:biotin-dependent carboxyltransferase [Gammaproteobacteria bacterium]